MSIARLKGGRLTLTFEDFEEKWRLYLHNEMDHDAWKLFCTDLLEPRVPLLVRLRVLQHLAADRLGLDPSLVLAYYNETVITMGHSADTIGIRLPQRRSPW